MSEQMFVDQFSLAARWGIALKTLRNWRHRKYGPSFTRVGRKTLYSLEDVMAFEAMNRVETNTKIDE